MRSIITFLIILSMHGCSDSPDIKSESQSSAGTEIGPLDNPAERLVAQMVNKVGNMEMLFNKGDVEYQYIYRAADGLEDVSTERYIFDGELSWAKYDKHQKSVLPDVKESVIQAYNGFDTQVKIGDSLVFDEKVLRRADFMRKTNYYWFVMMPKLMDPGIEYRLLPDRIVDSITYDVVEITFDEGVGDAQDKYVLYINPETNLVDQFLFTVMDFGRKEPFLMQVRYDNTDGLWLPTYRRYAPSNWDGQIIEPKWNEEISRNIRFNNGFTSDMFDLES